MAKRGQQNAVANARQRLLEVQAAVGTKHADYASALIQLALLLIMHGDPTEAEPLLREALEIRRETLGERHPDYATCLSSLAGLLWARGDLDAAEPLLRRALAIRSQVLGERHPKSIVSQNSLDQLLQAKKAWDSAAQLDESDDVLAATDETPAEVAAVLHGEETPEEPVVATAPEPAAASEPIEEPPPPVVPAPPEEAVVPPATPDVIVPPAPVVEADAAAGPTRTREELAAAVEALAAGFAGLGNTLEAAVGPFREQGVVPPDALVAALRDGRAQFLSLRGEVLQLAHGLGMTDAESRATESLQDLTGLLAELERYELERSRAGKARRDALGTLEQVARLVYADPKDFPPLRECQESARALHQAIEAAHPADLPSEAFALADGSHPYRALLALADADGGLNDEAWADALELVQTQLGKPLSVAAGRGKIAPGPSA